MKYSPCMYYGQTVGSVPTPVFWDPHTALFNNKPPATAIIGSTGSGKTNLAQHIAAFSALLGKITIIIDPKNDFSNLKMIEDDIGKVKIWPLISAKAGLLDPFYIARDESDQRSLALNVIEIFCGGLSGPEITVLAPILKDVIRNGNPTLRKVVDMLRGSAKPVARDLGNKLDLLSDLPIGKLCFAPGGEKRQVMDLADGTTVISLLGFDLEDIKQNNSKSLLMQGVLYLLLDYINRVLKDKDNMEPKTLIIDEAWAFVSNEKGKEFVKSSVLLGRSFGLATILCTQKLSHLKDIGLTATTSTYFIHSTGEEDAKESIALLGLPKDQGFEGAISNREPGECLMKDWGPIDTPRYSLIYVEYWNPKWKAAFTTNFYEKRERALNKQMGNS